MNKLEYKSLNNKMLLTLLLIMLLVSLLGGRAVNAADAAASGQTSSEEKEGAHSNVTLDVNHLSDGHYYIDYRVLYADQEKTSISSQYLVSPALLEVKGEQKSISLTVLQSKEIVGFKINGQEGVVSEEDSSNNSRVVTFQLDELTTIYPAWISIHWIVEAIDFKYIKSYDIRVQFLPETIVKVAEDAPVPSKSGTVGFPSGLNESDVEPTDEVTNEQEAQQESSQQSSASEQILAFNDIEKHWAKAAINSAIELGIATGHSDGTFRPNALIDRSQFAVMISRALKLPAGAETVAFADSQQIPTWAAEHVNAVVNAKLMSGYSDNTFRGGQHITRAELAVIIARAAKLDLAGGGALSFADNKLIPSWAQKEVAAAVAAGLVSGKSNNRFEPTAPTTRAEAITLIMRLLNSTS